MTSIDIEYIEHTPLLFTVNQITVGKGGLRKYKLVRHVSVWKV